MANFKVGQSVQCVESHPWGLVEEGQIFEVASTSSCCVPMIQLKGYFDEWKKTTCSSCGKILEGRWFATRRFRLLEYQSASSEILSKFPLTEEKADVKVREVQTAEH